PRRSRPACRSAASTTSTHRSGAWAARRCRCLTAWAWRKRPSRRARTSSASCERRSGRTRMPDINMPKLSDTMEEGTIVEWKKKSGDEVKTGEVLAEVESDKATFDLEADADGVLQILVDQGVPAKIGAPIARIGEAGAEPVPQPKAKPKEPETPPAVAEEPAPAPPSPSGAAPPSGSPGHLPTGGEELATADGRQDGRELKASPLARRLAEEMGVDL